MNPHSQRTNLEEILGKEGVLAGAIPGFNYRPQQLEMAKRVFDTLIDRETLITEAGTGTGKTFAYLAPALLSGRKIAISTGTKNLQDQLYHRDLPQMQKALSLPVVTALLKGRSNYLCAHRLQIALLEGRYTSRQQVEQLMTIRDWAEKTQYGDISELAAISEDSRLWPQVTSTTDNCLGQECDEYEQCHLVEARRKAQEADLVVVNHHLLCADFALKEEGFGELLPAVDGFIVDEAHQLPDTAAQFFGVSISARQLLELARDAESEYIKEAGDMPEFVDQTASLSKAVRDFRLVLGLDSRRGAWSDLSGDEQVEAALALLRGELQGVNQQLAELKSRGKGLESCYTRGEQLWSQLTSLGEQGTQDDVRWFETTRQGFRLNRTPLEIAEQFQEQMERYPAAWIFTSATLAVGESFTHFQHRLGIESANTARWESPFDYAEQSLWFVPKGLPDPRDSGYDEAVLEVAEQAINASRGRAFLLFTSHRALRLAAERLQSRIDYPLLVQGHAPKAELLEQFRTLGDAVLLGTASFWEGVDVRGEALSCVLIDKLPFASPGDPVLQARIDAMRQRGGNPFMEFQVPQAAIALKQGAGRLIRDTYDRGVLITCDPRLLKKGYGRTFLASMPAMARTRDMADVERFFDQ